MPEDHLSYGMLHRARAAKDTKIALHYFRRAIAEGDQTRDIHWMAAHQALTNLLNDLGRGDEALQEHRKWRDSEPDCAWAHVSYAYALAKSGYISEACQEITEALRLDEQDVNVQTMAGDLFAQAGRYEEAVTHWDKAYMLDNSCISCWFSKAEMYASTGQTEKAVQQYQGILTWLEEHGYNMDLEGIYPLQRIEELNCNEVKGQE
ncbi:MAG TPA: tetratricopeptide repeat protein [Candidatus Merdivicinus intestinigallinarum]|nr:tetratricopeptide repeat protein [Candidatus Merdivicinus intestinigallinarum]